MKTDFKAIKLKLASPEEILSWSYGEVVKPETINYRTQRPEKDGLFDERIFGPSKDWECYCGKYKRIRYKGIICDRCGVEITRSAVRRERMGHIKLAVPVAHIWFLKSVPSRISILLDIPQTQIESVIYFNGYIIIKVNDELRKKLIFDVEEEYKRKIKLNIKTEKKLSVKTRLNQLKNETLSELNSLSVGKVLNEVDYRNLSLKYGSLFEAESGSEAVIKVINQLDLKKELKESENAVNKATGQLKSRLLARTTLLKSLLVNKINPAWMFLTVLPVLPPDLRPMVPLEGGRFASADLNDLYRRVINRNNRLKKLLELKAPEVITRNEKRMLQEAVDALIDNSPRKQSGNTITASKRPLKSLTDMFKGKHGRFRGNLLGKRVDYSGRTVIVVGPELNIGECGIPKVMALELFKPFILREIIKKELAYNVKAANHLIEDGVDSVWEILEDIIKDKLVLLNRAPTLHRLNIQAFKLLLVEGLAIRLHPLVCRAFNADFDGDQMAVHLPITEASQKEAREIMFATKNLLKPADGQPIMRPTNDIILGCYFLTHIKEGGKGEGKIFSSKNEAVLAYQNNFIDINSKIKVYSPLKEGGDNLKFIETSVGRIIFNQSLPNDFMFLNKEMNMNELEILIQNLIERYGSEKVSPMLDVIKRLGFEYATLSGITWSMADLSVPVKKGEIIDEAKKEISETENQYYNGLLTKEERYNKVIEIWTRAMNKITDLVKTSLPKNSSVLPIILSRARGNWLQLNQMTALKGLIKSPSGEIIDLPILNSYKEGLSVLEYFISIHGARKGTADTALRTSVAGYLTRRLVDVAQDIIVREEDCGDTRGVIIDRQEILQRGMKFFSKIWGRTILEDIKIKKPILDGNKNQFIIMKKGDLIDKEKATLIDESNLESLKIRSVSQCQTKFGVCQKCYGIDLSNYKLVKLGEAIGIIAAQSIGEPGTQLTMRTFHTGGIAGAGDITMGLPRVEELFEARPPKLKALISELDGKVIDIKEEWKNKIIIIEPDLSSKPKTITEQPPTSLEKSVKSRKSLKKKPGDLTEYKVSSLLKVYVEKGSIVKIGDQLTEGHIDLKELFALKGQEVVKNYIINEIQTIYNNEGVTINDKHIEIIIRQMFSKVRVKNPGDSDFGMGEIVLKDAVDEVNNKLKSAGKEIVKFTEILMGITKASHYSQSFLSAASFQETVKVLINASLNGRVDVLRGLKENVILGRLIPAGTGFKKLT